MSTVVNQLSMKNVNSAGSGFDHERRNSLTATTDTTYSRRHYFGFDDLLSPYAQKKSHSAPASVYSISNSKLNFEQFDNGYTINAVRSRKTLLADQTILPSLRHLKLLPDPRIQEYAYNYPDTSEVTPTWKKNLVLWCKEKNYQDYVKIINETSFARFSSTQKIPSVLKPYDAFQNLTNTPNIYSELGPVTPPLSPNVRTPEISSQVRKINNISKVHKPEHSKTTNHNIFNPVISPKLIQLVKTQSIEVAKQSKSIPETETNEKNSKQDHIQRHKKTNSFKAKQLKQLLENRDLLSYNGARITNETDIDFKNSERTLKLNRVNKPIVADNSYKQRSRSLSPSRKNRTSLSPSRTLVMKLDNYRSRSGTTTPRSTSPIRTSPVTPPQNVLKYSKFNLESPPNTPKVKTKKSNNNSVNGSPTHKKGTETPSTPLNVKHKSKSVTPRRRSNGSLQNLSIRKCLSCNSSDSPCWRPSWSSKKHEQLCNSCGLRFKKTRTRCLNQACKKIPTKSELTIMKTNGIIRETTTDGASIEGYSCLFCNGITETLGAPMSPTSPKNSLTSNENATTNNNTQNFSLSHKSFVPVTSKLKDDDQNNLSIKFDNSTKGKNNQYSSTSQTPSPSPTGLQQSSTLSTVAIGK